LLCDKRIAEKSKNYPGWVKKLKWAIDGYNKLPFKAHLAIMAVTIAATAGFGALSVGALSTGWLFAERGLIGFGGMASTEGIIGKMQEKGKTKAKKAMKQGILNEYLQDADEGDNKEKLENLEFINKFLDKSEGEISQKFEEFKQKEKKQNIVKWGIAGAVGLAFAAGVPEKIFKYGWDKFKGKPPVSLESLAPKPNSMTQPMGVELPTAPRAPSITRSGPVMPESIKGMKDTASKISSTYAPHTEHFMKGASGGYLKTTSVAEELAGGGAKIAQGVEKAAEVSKNLIVETPKGGSVWSLAEENLAKQDWFTKLTGGDPIKETYVIDSVKKAVLNNRLEEGIAQEGLKIGEKVNLNILKDPDFISKMESTVIGKIQPGSEGYKHISEVNQILRNWVRNNPGKMLTTERARNIVEGIEKTGERIIGEGAELFKNSLGKITQEEIKIFADKPADIFMHSANPGNAGRFGVDGLEELGFSGDKYNTWKKLHETLKPMRDKFPPEKGEKFVDWFNRARVNAGLKTFEIGKTYNFNTVSSVGKKAGETAEKIIETNVAEVSNTAEKIVGEVKKTAGNVVDVKQAPPKAGKIYNFNRTSKLAKDALEEAGIDY